MAKDQTRKPLDHNMEKKPLGQTLFLFDILENGFCCESFHQQFKALTYPLKDIYRLRRI